MKNTNELKKKLRDEHIKIGDRRISEKKDRKR